MTKTMTELEVSLLGWSKILECEIYILPGAAPVPYILWPNLEIL